MDVTLLAQTPVREIVLSAPTSAPILESYGLDYCCKGGVKLIDACNQRSIDIHQVVKDLSRATDTTNGSHIRFMSWSTSLLCQYIVENHHNYMRLLLPDLETRIARVVEKHGYKMPEMNEVAGYVRLIHGEVITHQEKEEQILFPALCELRDDRFRHPARYTFGSSHPLQGPINAMTHDHEALGGWLESIRKLTQDFTPPSDACTTTRLVFKQLKELETDLHFHVHLENNILFPRAELV